MNDLAAVIKELQTDPKQLAERWAELETRDQIEVVGNITLPQELIASYWGTIGDEEDRNQFRFLCCKHQQIDPEFLTAHWGDLGIDAKFVTLIAQDQVPDELVKDFWDKLKSQTADDNKVVTAFASSVKPERQPEGFVPSEEDSEEESADVTCEPEDEK